MGGRTSATTKKKSLSIQNIATFLQLNYNRIKKSLSILDTGNITIDY